MKAIFLRPPAWLLALALFIVALIPRVDALGAYVTPDEPNWAYRTLGFGAALSRGDWAATAQAGHPGVTTMWLGALGISIERAIDPAHAADALAGLSKIDRLSAENIEAFRRIGALIDWARLPVILVNALGVAGAFLLLRRLLGDSIALLAGLLLALDPFLAGLGGLLHVDGLLATFTTLSLLSLLNALAYPQSTESVSQHSALSTQHSALPWFALSGAFVGLATLSKSPALFFLPFAALVIAVAALTRRVTLRNAVLGFSIFFILHSALFILLYPAMWVDPASALGLMFERATHHAVDATRPTFFDGQAELNHGPGFYPLALAYRLSPIVIAGLALAIVVVVWRRPLHSRTPTLPYLLLFSLSFILFLTPAAKKFDRYLLPAIPPLICIAAYGIDRLGENLPGRFAAKTPGALAVALQAVFLFSVAPYPLMAYNPILGGAAGARDRIAVGWGEGFGAAARWIAEHDPGATIAAGGLSNLAPLYSGRVVTIDESGLASADYIVFTVSEAQLFPDFFAGLARRGSLAQTIHIGGIDAAWIYADAQSTIQADWLRRETQPGDAILLDAPTPLARALDSIITLPVDAPPEAVSDKLLSLTDVSRILYVSTPAASPVVRRDVRRWLDAHARLESETSVAGGIIRTYIPQNSSPVSLDPFAVQFDNSLALIGLEPLADVAAYPDSISVAARWRVLAPPTSNYSVTFDLIDAAGDSWATFGGPLRDASDFAPIDWQPGQIFDQVFAVQVPPELVPGAYRLRFSVDRPDGARAGLVSASGVFSGTAPALTALRIDPARRPGDPAALAMRRIDRVWPGQIELLGSDVLNDALATGDQFLVTLHWRSLRDGLDPALEIHWLLESETGAHRFEWRTSLAPQAQSSFRNDDLIGARYSRRLPLDLPDGRYRLSLSIDAQPADLGSIDIAHLDRTFDLPSTAVPIGSIGAFDVFTAGSLPAQVRAGDALPATFALHAREEVNIDYTFFAHLIDPAGVVVAQVDTWPQGGAWPTSNWVQDQVVVDAYALALPLDAPPGDYTLVIGMYDSLDGSRLPVRDSEGHLTPDSQLTLRAPIQVEAP